MQEMDPLPNPDGSDALRRWLSPFQAAFLRDSRRRYAHFYVSHLLRPDRPKSLAALAPAYGQSTAGALHHFLTSAPWNEERLQQILSRLAATQIGSGETILTVKLFTLPRRGRSTVGIAQHTPTAGGRPQTCQYLLLVCIVSGNRTLPVGMRLYLPPEWAEDEDRCVRAGVPEAARAIPTLHDLILAEIDRQRAANRSFKTVCIDATISHDEGFRAALTRRGLAYCTSIPGTTPADSHHIPGRTASIRTVAEILPPPSAQSYTWPNAQNVRHLSHFQQIEIGSAATRDEVPLARLFLIGDEGGEGGRTYHIACFAHGPGSFPSLSCVYLQRMATMLRARRLTDITLTRLKADFGLGEFDGRTWVGLHRHLLLTCIAYCYRESQAARATPPTLTVTHGHAHAH